MTLRRASRQAGVVAAMTVTLLVAGCAGFSLPESAFVDSPAKKSKQPLRTTPPAQSSKGADKDSSSLPDIQVSTGRPSIRHARTAAVEPPKPAAAPAAPAPARPAPPIDVGGRWKLKSPEVGGACTLTLTTAANASEGSISPESTCPGDFYNSRRWVFDRGNLIIRSQRGEMLGQLVLTAGESFEGRSSFGQRISLER